MVLPRSLFSLPLAACALALAVALSPAPASAQEVNVDSLRALYMLEMPPTLRIAAGASRSSPGSSSGSPSAYGPNWGDGFVGMGYVHRARFAQNDTWRDNVDGAISGGFGLGNARDLIGVEVSIASFSTFDSGFGSRMGVGLKLHKALPGDFGVAIGVENAFTRGVTLDPSYYGVVTRVWSQDWWNPFTNITATLGAGNGRFQREEDFNAGRNRINPFAAVGVQVWEPVAFIADWTGQDLVLAVSIVPFVRVPLVITPAFNDVLGTAGDGVRFTVGAGVGFQFGKLRDLVF
jgi:hypothetical protein